MSNKDSILHRDIKELLSNRKHSVLFISIWSVAAVLTVIFCIGIAWKNTLEITLDTNPWIVSLFVLFVLLIITLALKTYSTQQNLRFKLLESELENLTLENERNKYQIFIKYFAETFLSSFYVNLSDWSYLLYTRDKYFEETYPDIPDNFLEYYTEYQPRRSSRRPQHDDEVHRT